LYDTDNLRYLFSVQSRLATPRDEAVRPLPKTKEPRLCNLIFQVTNGSRFIDDRVAPTESLLMFTSLEPESLQKWINIVEDICITSSEHLLHHNDNDNQASVAQYYDRGVEGPSGQRKGSLRLVAKMHVGSLDE
jgi:hypothetical protein